MLNSALRYCRYLLNLKPLYIISEGLGLFVSCSAVAGKAVKKRFLQLQKSRHHSFCAYHTHANKKPIPKNRYGQKNREAFVGASLFSKTLFM